MIRWTCSSHFHGGRAMWDRMEEESAGEQEAMEEKQKGRRRYLGLEKNEETVGGMSEQGGTTYACIAPLKISTTGEIAAHPRLSNEGKCSCHLDTLKPSCSFGEKSVWPSTSLTPQGN